MRWLYSQLNSAYGAHSVLVRLGAVEPAARTRVHAAGAGGRVLRAGPVPAIKARIAHGIFVRSNLRKL